MMITVECYENSCLEVLDRLSFSVFAARYYASAAYAIIRCLSGRPSVCLCVCLSRS